MERSGAYYYRIATPEKALCDELYAFPPVSNVNSLLRLLTEDLRIEESDLKKLNRETVVGYADAYRSTNVKRMGHTFKENSKMSTAIEQMLKVYHPENIYEQKNAMREVMQEIVLCGLSRAGFFKKWLPFTVEQLCEFFMVSTASRKI